MRIIGITGGIGAGKTKVLDILHDRYNAYIVEADKVAHSLMKRGTDVYKSLADYFGDGIIDYNTREIDRQALGRLVMNNTVSLEKLNSIVHPAVKEYIINDIQHQKELGTKYYVLEAALLIQTGYKAVCDEIWAVITDREIRIERLIQNRNFTREKAEDFIKNQPADTFYTEGSDRVIWNNGPESELIKAIDELLLL